MPVLDSWRRLEFRPWFVPTRACQIYHVDRYLIAEYYSPMSKLEILEALPRLTSQERREILLRLSELDGEAWLDADDPLTESEKALLNARLASYEKDPDAGSSWAEVEARIRSRLSQ